MHALLIEDEILLVLMMEDLLADLGFTSFQSAPTAAAAIQAARSRKPNLIASDCRLREGTGTEAVDAILSEQIVPVIFTTGHANLVRGLVPWPVLSKPVGRPALIRAIDEARRVRDKILNGESALAMLSGSPKSAQPVWAHPPSALI